MRPRPASVNTIICIVVWGFDWWTPEVWKLKMQFMMKLLKYFDNFPETFEIFEMFRKFLGTHPRWNEHMNSALRVIPRSPGWRFTVGRKLIFSFGWFWGVSRGPGAATSIHHCHDHLRCRFMVRLVKSRGLKVEAWCSSWKSAKHVWPFSWSFWDILRFSEIFGNLSQVGRAHVLRSERWTLRRFMKKLNRFWFSFLRCSRNFRNYWEFIRAASTHELCSASHPTVTRLTVYRGPQVCGFSRAFWFCARIPSIRLRR